VVVVGAGLAGIAAARTALGYGARVLVLEAMDRVGGRVFTDDTTFAEIGFDQGAQFFQQALSGNELKQIADAVGIPNVDATTTEQGLIQGRNPPDPANAAAFLATAAEVQAAILAFGAAAQGDPSVDQPVANVIGSFAQDPFFQAFKAVNLDLDIPSLECSTIDYFNFLEISPEPFSTPGDAFLVPSGMGNFITSLADGLPIRLSAPVERISRGPDGVTIQAGGQSFRARTVIVTASAKVLAGDVIEFQPALPEGYVEGFASLPLVSCYKCLLGFRSGAPFPDRFTILQPLVDGPTPAFFPRFWGTNHLEIIAGGDLARQLELNGTENAIRDLLARLEVSFPGCTGEFDGRISQSSWLTNQFIQGAYSGALPGAFTARAALSQPVDGQIWFAGEALAPGGAHSSMHGAHRTGVRAAIGALHSLGMARDQDA
jgi:monoamine oxidase